MPLVTGHYDENNDPYAYTAPRSNWTDDWGDGTTSGGHSITAGPWINKPVTLEERRVAALERIADALERLAPKRPAFLQGPFEVDSDPYGEAGDDLRQAWINAEAD